MVVVGWLMMMRGRELIPRSACGCGDGYIAPSFMKTAISIRGVLFAEAAERAGDDARHVLGFSEN